MFPHINNLLVFFLDFWAYYYNTLRSELTKQVFLARQNMVPSTTNYLLYRSVAHINIIFSFHFTVARITNQMYIDLHACVRVHVYMCAIQYTNSHIQLVFNAHHVYMCLYVKSSPISNQHQQVIRVALKCWLSAPYNNHEVGHNIIHESKVVTIGSVYTQIHNWLGYNAKIYRHLNHIVKKDKLKRDQWAAPTFFISFYITIS